MRKLPLSLPFFLALFYAVLGTALFPSLHLHPFAPFLAVLAYRLPLNKVLWCATGCGLIIDLLSSHLYFGLYALNYCITLFALYNQKRHFFEDKPFSVPLLTLLISIMSCVIELFFEIMGGHEIPFSLPFLLIEFLVMPLADGIYAYLWFVLPCMGFLYVRKKGAMLLFKQLLDSLNAK